MQGTDQVGMKKRDAGIDHADQDALLRSIDGFGADIVDVDSRRADNVSYGLASILEVPLFPEACVRSLRLGTEVRTGGRDGGFRRQDLTQLVRRQRLGRAIVEADPESGQAPLERQRILGFDGRDLLGRGVFLVGHEDDPRLEDIRRHRDDVQQAEQSSQQELLEGQFHV